MTAADSAWLRMDEPSNRMTITGVLAFERPLPFDSLKALFLERLARHDRFRQRLIEPRFGLGKPSWRFDEDFDIDRHVVRASLRPPAGKTELQDLVSELMATPFDLAHPRWQFHYVDNFRYGSAVVMRVHHCIGDGMSLVQVLLGLTDPVPGESSWAPPAVGAAASSDRSPNGLPRRLTKPIALAASATATLARVVLRRADPPTRLRGPLGVPKRCAWSSPFPLDEVKDLGRRLGATVNDILVSVVAGALRRYLEGIGQPTEGLNLRAIVPVNLRPAHDLHTLGNRFGMVFLPVPVGVEHPLDRLRVVKRRMDRLKQSPEAWVTFALLRLFGLTTPRMVSWAIDLFGRKATAVLTNVPGPRQALRLCGERVDGLMFWVPQSGALAMGISILSYDGGVRVGVATDAGLVPDPESIVAGYRAALDELKACSPEASA